MCMVDLVQLNSLTELLKFWYDDDRFSACFVKKITK